MVNNTGAISWTGSEKLERVVALVGCLCCIPLSFVYPTMLHIKIAESTHVIVKDVVIIIFGIIACAFTTVITIEQWGSPGGGKAPGRCG